MAEPKLTELDWRRFSRGRGLKHEPLAKALAVLEQGASAPPAEKLQWMQEVERQIDRLQTDPKADEALKGHLAALEKICLRERQSLELQKKAGSGRGAAAPGAGAAAADADDAPALLTTKLQTLLREVAKGRVVQVMVALADKECAVLASEHGVGPTQRKVLATALQAKGTLKTLVGQCLFEEQTHTFVLEPRSPGLAKLIAAALRRQIRQRYKVRVRGTDPADVETDGGDGEDGEDEAATAQGAGPDAPLDAQGYAALWAAMEPRYMQAMRRDGGDPSRLRALLGFCTGKAETGQFEAARRGLEALAAEIERQAQEAAKAAGRAAAQGNEAVTRARATPAQAFTQRLADLMPTIGQAVAAAPKAGAAIRARAREAGALAAQGQTEAAEKLLDQVARMLEALTQARSEEALAAAEATAATASVGSGPQSWHPRLLLPLREVFTSEFRAVLKAVLKEVDDSPPLKRLEDNLGNYSGVFFERTFKELLTKDEQRSASQVREQLALARQRIVSDRVIRHLGTNPFHPTDLLARLERGLDEIELGLPA